MGSVGAADAERVAECPPRAGPLIDRGVIGEASAEPQVFREISDR